MLCHNFEGKLHLAFTSLLFFPVDQVNRGNEISHELLKEKMHKNDATYQSCSESMHLHEYN